MLLSVPGVSSWYQVGFWVTHALFVEPRSLFSVQSVLTGSCLSAKLRCLTQGLCAPALSQLQRERGLHTIKTGSSKVASQHAPGMAFRKLQARACKVVQNCMLGFAPTSLQP